MIRQFLDHIRHYRDGYLHHYRVGYLKGLAWAQRKTNSDLPKPDLAKPLITTTDYQNPDLTEVTERGLRKAYMVLNPDLPLGYVRPVRYAYVHLTCGEPTVMFHEIAETYARDPRFYTHTYCATCEEHFPVGKDGEFVWEGTTEKVGT